MSDENTGNVEKLIGEIRQLAVPDISRTGTIALINLVPYAGGSIATVMAEFQSKTKVEKICDALALLDRKVKESGTKVEDILDQEQVVKLIHETIEKIALSSEEKHITYLKNALVSSFTNESIPYEQKKLYMSIVRALTGIEIKLLETFYEMVDPFVIDVPKERPQLTPGAFGQSGLKRLRRGRRRSIVPLFLIRFQMVRLTACKRPGPRSTIISSTSW